MARAAAIGTVAVLGLLAVQSDDGVRGRRNLIERRSRKSASQDGLELFSIDHVAPRPIGILRSRAKYSACLYPLEPDAETADEQCQADQTDDQAYWQHDHGDPEAQSDDHEDESHHDGQHVLEDSDETPPRDDM
jgi:hypothetical protein